VLIALPFNQEIIPKPPGRGASDERSRKAETEEAGVTAGLLELLLTEPDHCDSNYTDNIRAPRDEFRP
jgi:hypothetical protein